MKHTTIALFVPHKGCPHQCSFCNQKSISGESRSITAADVEAAVETAKQNPYLKNAEIAFFGGSFTAIDRGYMLSLLEAAQKYIDSVKICGIRISTRPDAVDDEICGILKSHGVTAVELGAQSMSDKVLMMNKRGHTAADVESAIDLLKKYGFETGLQMMTGLYGSDKNESIVTARKIIELKPDTVRIYPTVVMENTELADLYYKGIYRPQTVDEAAEICAELILMFESAGIRIIRVGLHSGGGVEQGRIAGAFHPAFKEICESKIYLKETESQLAAKGEYTVYVPKGALSQAIGQKKSNLIYLAGKGYSCRFKESDSLVKYQVLVKEMKYDT